MIPAKLESWDDEFEGLAAAADGVDGDSLIERCKLAFFVNGQSQQVSQQISSIAAQRMVNRLELRNQIFQVLTPQQQQQYIQIVQQNLEGLE